MRARTAKGHQMNAGLVERAFLSRGGTLLFQKTREMQGHALIMAVVFVFFLTLFGMAFYQFAETDVDLIGSQRNAMGAFYAGQAGLEKTAWILKHRSAIEAGGGFPNLNPFSPAFYSDGHVPEFQQVAHDNHGVLSPGGEVRDRYFRINRVDARVVDEANPRLMSGIRVQVLGALDVDGDFDGTDFSLDDVDSEGFPIDPVDVNRKFEAMIGLPGSLAENLSAGTPVFRDENGFEISNFPENYERLITQDGYDVPQESGFLYHSLGDLAGWDQYNYIFGKPIRQGAIELPPGLFDGNGIPQLAYFTALDPRQYTGNQVFDRDNDPTDDGGNTRSIIYVTGNVTMQDVDFGYLDNNGVLRGCDWAGADVTIVATGTLTARDIQCGYVGRLTLIARNILLVGDYDTRINGFALAGSSITLDDQETPADPRGCPNGVLKQGANPAEPLRITAYFMGTMLAGSSINLKNAGWTVLFDEKVTNGLMYDNALPQPTVVYETAENENLDFPYPRWQEMGNQLKARQEAYTAEEIGTGAAASWDLGDDDAPNLMRMYHDDGGLKDGQDDHDYGVSDGLGLYFGWLEFGLQDWSNYRALTFWMSLNNWKIVSGSRETLRMFYCGVQLVDNPATWNLTGFYLSADGLYDSRDQPGYSAWKHVRIPLGLIEPTSGFDIKAVHGVEFWLLDIELSWYTQTGVRQWIDYNSTPGEYGSDGYFVFHLGGPDVWGRSTYPVRLRQDPAAGNKHKLYYTEAAPWIDPHQMPGDPGYDPSYDEDIKWNPDPANPSLMQNLYMEDQFNPTMRIDQIAVSGKPASNAFLEYGLPRGFRYAVTHLREYQTF